MEKEIDTVSPLLTIYGSRWTTELSHRLGAKRSLAISPIYGAKITTVLPARY